MPDQTPSVAVVMTAHNAAFSVREAVLSITGQTLPDIEIIAVDDASTDETPAILHEIAAADPRLRVLVLPRNVGAFAAANAGLALARASVDGLVRRAREDAVVLGFVRGPPALGV